MHIEFTAHDVSYNEALGGDIVQVSFEEDSNDDSIHPSKYYLNFSSDWEFPPFRPTIEWFDGSDSQGGADMLNYKLNRQSMQVWLDNDMSFDIGFKIEESLFNKVREYISSLSLDDENA